MKHEPEDRDEARLWRDTYVASVQGWLCGAREWWLNDLRTAESHASAMANVADLVASRLATKAVARWRQYRSAETAGAGPPLRAGRAIRVRRGGTT